MVKENTLVVVKTHETLYKYNLNCYLFKSPCPQGIKQKQQQEEEKLLRYGTRILGYLDFWFRNSKVNKKFVKELL